MEPPRGLVLTRGNAPALHTLVDTLRRRVKGPHATTLLLSGDLDATLLRVPGSLLSRRNTLVIGLPLLLALPRHQFRAVLARALASSHGNEADALAARATRRADLAAALLRLRISERFLAERFYPRLLADVRRCGVPPSGVQARFAQAMPGIPTDPRFLLWLDAALQSDAGPPDAAGTLQQRLAVLGIAAPRAAAFLDRVFGSDRNSAGAISYLGDTPLELTLSIEKAWIDDVQQAWSARHEELKRLDERRRELDRKPRLTFAEALDHVIATAETEGEEAALQFARDLIGCRPDTAPARFVLGALLLRRNDAEGLVHLEVAMSRDPELVSVGCDIAREFLRANGREAEITALEERHATPACAG